MTTLTQLAAILASRPREKPLICPACPSSTFTGSGPYVCASCQWTGMLAGMRLKENA